MCELPDRYVFDTLLDGQALFYKKNYWKHARVHPIGSPEDLRKIQEVLIDPDVVTKHDRMMSGRRLRHHIYYIFHEDPDAWGHSAYPKFWKVVIRLVGAKRHRWWCVVTAFPGAKPPDRAINKRQERVIYTKDQDNI